MKQKRQNGMGTLFKRGNMWWGGILFHGTMHRMSLGVHVAEAGVNPETLKANALKELKNSTAMFRLESRTDTLMLVKAKLEGMKNELENAKKTASAKLCELYSIFEKSKRRREVKAERLAQYECLCVELIELKGKDYPISDFSRTDAEEYITNLEDVKKIAASTINLKLIALNYMWNTIGEQAGAPENPWKYITKRKAEITSHETFTDNEIELIKNGCKNRYEGEMRRLVVIGANTGMRISDCASLQWEEVDLNSGFIRKKTKKTGAEVSIPLLSELREELTNLKNELGGNPTGSILPKIHASYMKSKSVISTAFTVVLEQCNIETSKKMESCKRRRQIKGFHSFRHTAATKLIESGIPIEIVRSIFGHTTDKMTRHYTHIREQAIKDAFEKANVK